MGRTPLSSPGRVLALTAGLALCLACDDASAPGLDDAPAGPSRAYSAWTPGPKDTCTQAIHDQYAVVGPDGKLYPTWHPAVDPGTGCTFGHEHGRNPAGSNLFDDVGYIPFGYANEAADLFAPHPGYKVEWANDVKMSTGLGAVGNALLDIRCDVMFELHQGTAGSGRFVNPDHEIAYHVKCNEGTELHLQFVTTIGHSGEFVRSCDSGTHIKVADREGRDGGGKRLVPDRECMERHILVPEGTRSNFGAALRESWQFSESIRTAGGHSLVSIGPYFNVFNPSRYHDPASPDLLGSVVDLCWEVTAGGERASGGACDELIESGFAPPSWDSPRSPWNGTNRDVDINSIRVRNASGPEVWYTDAYGENARREPFPGSIRQFISKVDNEAVTPSGPSIGRNRDYDTRGVHAPN